MHVYSNVHELKEGEGDLRRSKRRIMATTEEHEEEVVRKEQHGAALVAFNCWANH